MDNKNIEINGIIYTIYENGDVYHGHRKIKQRPNNPDGYACFTAGKKHNRISIKTHTVVGKLFVDNPNNYPEIDHLDGDRMNPNANNLEWVTHEENIKRAYQKGKYKSHITGENNPKAKLKEDTIKQIRKDYENGLTQKKISLKYEVP